MEEIERRERNRWSGEVPFTGALLIRALQKQDEEKKPESKQSIRLKLSSHSSAKIGSTDGPYIAYMIQDNPNPPITVTPPISPMAELGKNRLASAHQEAIKQHG